VPIYEYQCKACGHMFEIEHAIGENKTYKCPECSCKETQKLVSQVGVIFKGTGFYRTDNRKSGNGGGKSSSDKGSKKEKTEKTELPSPASEN
jgi:putative FmdB family regulatory protein